MQVAAPLPYYPSVYTNTLDGTQEMISIRSSQDNSLEANRGGFMTGVGIKDKIVTKVKQRNHEYLGGFTEKKEENDADSPDRDL